MRRLVIGCGYLGLRAARVWRARGDRVTALTRSAERAGQLRAEGIEPVVGDVLVPESLAKLPEAETVLYAVGLDRNSGASRREVYVTGLANVLSQMAGRAQRVISISSTSVYGQDAGEWVDETSLCEPDFENGRICLEAEQTARRHSAVFSGASAGAPSSMSLNILRLAGIYGPHRLLRRMELLHSGVLLEGPPDAWLNLIHVDDAVRAVIACEERGRPGATYLVCDDRPVRRGEYFAMLASLIGAPEPRFEASGGEEPWRGEPSGGEQPKSLLHLNQRCSNRKLREELGVELAFPTYADGLPLALSAR